MLACMDPCSLCLPSDQRASHPLVLCAGSTPRECVYFRVCDSHFLCSASEAKLCGTAGPPFILNSLFLFLFLSPSLPRVALLIGLARVLRNAGACLNGCHSGIHLQMGAVALWLELEGLRKRDTSMSAKDLSLRNEGCCRGTVATTIRYVCR